MTLELDHEPHVLIVDDDQELRLLVSRLLRKNGFRVTGARDGREMRVALSGAAFDLIVLDLMLPGGSGLDLCRELRATSAVPIVIVTAVGEESDRVIGLEMGADDYICKPFSPRELLARARAVIRRSLGKVQGERPSGSQKYEFSGWSLDLLRRELVSPKNVAIDLSGGEFDLLLAFIEHPGRVLSRDQLLDLARNRTADPFDRSIDVQISRLRRKIDAHSDQPLIKTVRGAGYIFTAPVQKLR